MEMSAKEMIKDLMEVDLYKSSTKRLYKFTGYVNSMGYLVSSDDSGHPKNPDANILVLTEFNSTNKSGSYTVQISFINGYPEYEDISFTNRRTIKKFKNVFKITPLPTEKQLLNSANNE